MTNGRGLGGTVWNGGSVLAAFLERCNVDALRTLMVSTPVVLGVLADDLTVLFCNERTFWTGDDAAALHAAVTAQACGRHLPLPLIEERQALIRQVFETGVPLAVHGVIRGRLICTAYIPGADGDGRRCVLAVAYPVTEFGGVHNERLGEDRTGIPIMRARNDDLGPLESLTERELQILRFIGQGLTAAEIGKRLHRAVKTIEGHRVSLGTKLQLKGKADLVRVAIASGLTTLTDREITLLARQARLTRELT